MQFAKIRKKNTKNKRKNCFFAKKIVTLQKNEILPIKKPKKMKKVFVIFPMVAFMFAACGNPRPAETVETAPEVVYVEEVEVVEVEAVAAPTQAAAAPAPRPAQPAAPAPTPEPEPEPEPTMEERVQERVQDARQDRGGRGAR